MSTDEVNIQLIGKPCELPDFYGGKRELRERVLLLVVNVIFLGIIIIIGLIGNLLTGLILFRDNSRSPMNFLLEMLALCMLDYVC